MSDCPYVYTEVLNDSFQKIYAYVYDPCHCGRPQFYFWECWGTLILTLITIISSFAFGVFLGYLRFHKNQAKKDV